MDIDLDTWIVSDTHFGHRNIVKYAGRPMNHDQIMAENWKNTVGEGEKVLHLGDLMVWYNKEWIEEAKEIVTDLPGEKYIILGNHDRLRPHELEKLGFAMVEPFTAKIDGKKIAFSHYPLDTGHFDVNIHGHIHTNPSAHPAYSHKNVSIEVMDYRPVRLRDILG